MKFDILTLFPELITNYFEDSILNKAKQNKIIDICFHQLRDYAEDKHRQVDDTVYGGGSGMLLKADVLGRAVEAIKNNNNTAQKIIYLSPQGKKLNNVLARELAESENDYILVCGRYEGVDQRFIEQFVDIEISIGDYVISGGELAACVLIDAVSRFLPGVIGSRESVNTDSFENSKLKYPQYTRPSVYRGAEVPAILLSGNHEEIAKWRSIQSECKTIEKKISMYSCLVHYPVKNKLGEIISTAVTNFDVHDIARISKTYGYSNYYIVTPIKEQQALVNRIVEHWKGPYGRKRNNKRSMALDNILVLGSLENVVSDIESKTGKKVKIITTSARKFSNSVSFEQLASYMSEDYNYLMVFGTGWGLIDGIIDNSDYVLEPVITNTGYNHLSVRSAVSIIMDRLYNELV